MGVVVISSLVIKRQLEKRKRRWRVWVLDVLKQLVGQAVIHGLNLLVSRRCVIATSRIDTSERPRGLAGALLYGLR